MLSSPSLLVSSGHQNGGALLFIKFPIGRGENIRVASHAFLRAKTHDCGGRYLGMAGRVSGDGSLLGYNTSTTKFKKDKMYFIYFHAFLYHALGKFNVYYQTNKQTKINQKWVYKTDTIITQAFFDSLSYFQVYEFGYENGPQEAIAAFHFPSKEKALLFFQTDNVLRQPDFPPPYGHAEMWIVCNAYLPDNMPRKSCEKFEAF